MLRDTTWKSVYRTGEDDLLKDFYLKALSESVRYDRAVGYFSSELITFASSGISELIRSGGRMRLVIGHPLDDDEYAAIKDGHSVSWVYDDLEQMIVDTLEGSRGPVASYRLSLLTWMLACGALEIKFAFRKRGMYHEKIGVMSDSSGDSLVFQGSANETINALHIDSNAESISVFPSWKEEIFEAYGQPFIRGFDSLWGGHQKDTLTVSMPSEIYERIASNVGELEKPDLDFEEKLAESAQLLAEVQDSPEQSHPFVPEVLGGRPFVVREHQKTALTKWRANEYRGILKLATGSGKTITAIYGAVKIYEAFGKLALVIAVPYVELAIQWVSNLRDFGIYPHRCYDSRKNWYDRLKLDIQAFNVGARNFLPIVVVNKTLGSEHFVELLSQLPEVRTLFVGDECHRHGSSKLSQALPPVSMRLGLSATPFRSDEDEIDSPFPDDAKRRLEEYYGAVVDEYTLSDAINDDVLTPYTYHVHIVRLTDEEQEQYEDLTTRIGHLISRGEVPSSGSNQPSSLTMLCGERSRLLGSAGNKIPALKALLGELSDEERAHALFYCAEGASEDDGGEYRNIDRVSNILKAASWRVSHFTSKETTSERKSLMRSFLSGGIDGLVSMKVLDEGIDIPVCRTAFILASTKNPRQYVQRRGRILRKYPGKDRAEIHDFVVAPCLGWEETNAGKGLMKSEMERVYDFMELALNKRDIYEALETEGFLA
ncbi:DEAD/DEAH box helicase [Halieaceae bacterium IMCC8485]|uniref:DEAD/DEAH box helicase n=1 Tax=Candidatus Seongchinamella marina TaxID=2518990 RepID=A0ABT3T0D3_9GAMM|nr:DEAD/DEAH box helicase family protein [Candidatus Seongchinamella marina]MCX2975718.1 DEAD/DEAH box helicase [Candidatus Seongchinamella marina]